MASLKSAGGYHGGVAPAISAEDVARQALEIARDVPVEELDALAGDNPHLRIDDLHAGYGNMEILHGFSLRVGHKQSLCLIGPNGAGKSTVLHSIFGFTNVYSGMIATERDGIKIDVTGLSANEKLRSGGIAYILQDKSVFPGMTVEENLWMGGYIINQPAEAKCAARRCSTNIRGWRRGASIRPRCCRAASGGSWKSAARWSWTRRFSWWTSPRSA